MVTGYFIFHSNVYRMRDEPDQLLFPVGHDGVLFTGFKSNQVSYDGEK